MKDGSEINIAAAEGGLARVAASAPLRRLKARGCSISGLVQNERVADGGGFKGTSKATAWLAEVVNEEFRCERNEFTEELVNTLVVNARIRFDVWDFGEGNVGMDFNLEGREFIKEVVGATVVATLQSDVYVGAEVGVDAEVKETVKFEVGEVSLLSLGLGLEGGTARDDLVVAMRAGDGVDVLVCSGAVVDEWKGVRDSLTAALEGLQSS